MTLFFDKPRFEFQQLVCELLESVSFSEDDAVLFGPHRYADKDALVQSLNAHRRVFVVACDYTNPPPSQIRHVERPLIALSSVPVPWKQPVWQRFNEWRYVDFNFLGCKLEPVQSQGGGFVYWGRWKNDRKRLLRKWCKDVDFIYSSMDCSIKYRSIMQRAKWMGYYWSYRCLADHGRTVYLQNQYNLDHGHHHVAYRFFEAMSAGLEVIVPDDHREAFDRLEVHPDHRVLGQYPALVSRMEKQLEEAMS